MGLTNVIKMLAMACPPPMPQSPPPVAPRVVAPAPAPSIPPAAVVDDYRLWLSGLSLHDRLRHDRAFGRAWFEGKSKRQCQEIARQAVEKTRQVRAGSKISRKAEQPSDHADSRHKPQMSNREG